jgi:hypothetical protein
VRDDTVEALYIKQERDGMWGIGEGVRWCRDMRVGRGDGSTDDAYVCGLRTVRHTRPEVESMCVHRWVWLLERHVYTYTGLVETRLSTNETGNLLNHAGRLIKRTITHAGGAVCLVSYH